MSEQALARIHTLPTRAPLVRPGGPWRALLVWALGAAVAGGLLGVAVQILVSTLGEQRQFDWWFVRMSILMAEGITLTTFVGSRYAFPQFRSVPRLLRYGLILLTVLGGALAVTLLSVISRPGVVVTRPVDFLALVAANTILAFLIGGALIAWDQLQTSLERAYDELRVKEAFEREMQVAREVQQELLPEAPPRLPGWEIAYTCRPAAAVGGDTFDFLELPDGRLGITVGDVVGKGIAAALLMANIQALARALAPREEDPAELNQHLSESLSRSRGASRLVTFAYVTLDPRTGEVAYSLAGHHPPLITGPRGVRSLDRGGLPLGVGFGPPYESGRDRLEPGESLVIFTDGLVEAPAKDDPDDDLGTERVRELLARSADVRGAGALLERLVTAWERHTDGAEASDDMTIVVVSRLDGGDAT
ncbi:MAG: hypothetical protein Kow0062_19680 [Acidobacteriota bacterium]